MLCKIKSRDKYVDFLSLLRKLVDHPRKNWNYIFEYLEILSNRLEKFDISNGAN